MVPAPGVQPDSLRLQRSAISGLAQQADVGGPHGSRTRRLRSAKPVLSQNELEAQLTLSSRQTFFHYTMPLPLQVIGSGIRTRVFCLFVGGTFTPIFGAATENQTPVTRDTTERSITEL